VTKDSQIKSTINMKGTLRYKVSVIEGVREGGLGCVV